MSADGKDLAEVLGEFARTMVTDFPIQAILNHLVVRIVDIMPISSAGVTLIAPGKDPRYVAASDSAALRYEKLQTELSEGPCVLAYQLGTAVASPDLLTERRFSAFTPRAVTAGLRAVFTFPLFHGDHQLSALDLYRETPGMLSPELMATAQILADVAAAYLLNAQAREDLQESADQIRHAALHDGLTGLPNRTLLMDRLRRAFLRSRGTGKDSALLYIDLDRFKIVNDTYGHGVGDTLLVSVARRLTERLRPEDSLARLSGDEFVVLCEDLDNVEQAEHIATRLRLALARPFLLSGHNITVGASIGIAYADRGAEHDPERLLHAADTAMYRAKRGGGRLHQVFTPQPDVHLAEMERELHSALDRHELYLVYQPIVAVADGTVTGMEALLRWDHPLYGSVPPDTFIPAAEQSDLIVDIGRWVLRQAAADAGRWQHRAGATPLPISVNVSAYQLMSAEFIDTVAATLSTGGLDPAQLILEITESVFAQDSDRALVVLENLKELGVRIALDDFGTGYSSLTYLRRFPVDIVKIDRSFIADLGLDSASDIIVGSVIKLAHDLHLSVTAEGIETSYQYEQIVALGSDYCQGFYFAHPMDGEAIGQLLQSQPDGNRPSLPRPPI